MCNVIAICCVCAFLPLTAIAQGGDESAKPTRKGDSIAVKGCLSGTALEATESSAPDLSGLLAGGLTFRLTGDKALIRQLRARHDRHIVEIRGVLKSDLPRRTGQSRSIGNTRITIGAASPEAGRPGAESSRSLPVLEVKSFDGGQTSCGR